MPAPGVQLADDSENFALSLEGLSDEDARVFAGILNLSRAAGWKLVDSDSFDAAVVDLRSPKAQNLLRTRPLGAVVVMAVRDGGAASPGTVPLELPLREDSVWTALSRVREILHRRLFLLRRSSGPAAPPRVKPKADDDADAVAHFDHLEGLANYFRTWSSLGDKVESTLCWIEGTPFLLIPKEKVWHSVRDSSIFRTLRGRTDLKVRILTGQLASAHRAGSPRRLGDFLWHLGLHSGDGRLLKEISPDAPLKLKRWPPLLGSENRTFYFRIGAMLSQQPSSPNKLGEVLGYERTAVNDFINACFVTNCIERLATAAPEQEPPNLSSAPAERPAEVRSLFGRIRRRLGLG